MKQGKKIFVIAMLVFAILVQTACGNQSEKEESNSDLKVFTIGNQDVYLNEVWIYAKTIKEGYEKNYGTGVWNITMEDEDGTIRTMEDITRRDIVDTICCTKLLVKKAEEYGVTLVESDIANANEQAQDFFSKLTDRDKEESGITLELLQTVFQENALAQKVYDKVIKESGIEVSDEEARMTTFYDLCFACYKENDAGEIIMLSDEEKAEIRKSAEEAFNTLNAADNTKTLQDLAYIYGLRYAGEQTLSKTELITNYGESMTNSIYSMENGTYSGILESQYGYHIIGMTALTDEAATALEKQTLLEEKKKEYFQTTYRSWLKQEDSSFSYDKDVNQEVFGKIEFIEAEDEAASTQEDTDANALEAGGDE